MTPNFILLEARIRKELHQLEKLQDELNTLTKLKEQKLKSIKLRAYASILHDFYSGIEKIFISIAREVDQMVPKSEGWHRELLEQMMLDVPSRRPAVINSHLAERLQQYLGFRHRFRNLYGYELEWARMELLVLDLAPTFREFRGSLESFLDLLPEIQE
jgi:hypothetical protein